MQKILVVFHFFLFIYSNVLAQHSCTTSAYLKNELLQVIKSKGRLMLKSEMIEPDIDFKSDLKNESFNYLTGIMCSIN